MRVYSRTREARPSLRTHAQSYIILSYYSISVTHKRPSPGLAEVRGEARVVKLVHLAGGGEDEACHLAGAARVEVLELQRGGGLPLDEVLLELACSRRIRDLIERGQSGHEVCVLVLLCVFSCS